MQPARLTVLTIVLVLSILSSASTASADAQTYMIPLYGFKWSESTIDFKVPSEPRWAHDTVLVAMDIWNQAQEWFKATYYPTGFAYKFQESQNSVNQVIFQSIYNPDYAGYAEWWSQGGIALSSQVTLVLVYSDGTNRSSKVLLGIAVHEFGHVLGLDHTPVASDIMCTSQLYHCDNGTLLPSTLDLYAIHILAEGTTFQTASLPAEIPYEKAPIQVSPCVIPGPCVLGLTVKAPSTIGVSVDGKEEATNAFISLKSGQHYLTAPKTVQLDTDNRLVFDWWVLVPYPFQETQSLEISVTIADYNMTVELNYHMQHRLTINDSATVYMLHTGDGWYDENSDAKFSIPSTTQPMSGILGQFGGKWVLEGWYENGKLATSSTSGVISMDKAHALEIRWRADYTSPLAIILAIILGLLVAVELLMKQKHTANGKLSNSN
jgi:hypothetical protein